MPENVRLCVEPQEEGRKDGSGNVAGIEPGRDLVALDDALGELAKRDERKSRVVELRFFAGLSVEETAAVLDVSPDTVMRDWKAAKAWLLDAISSGH